MMAGYVWDSAPSPQPSPQRGEGVRSCGVWTARLARRAVAWIASYAAVSRAGSCQRAPFLCRSPEGGKAQAQVAGGRLMAGYVWNSAPSPQPSPQRGEGVRSCGVWTARSARRAVSYVHFYVSIRQANSCQTTPPLPRLTPSFPFSSGERARVRGKIFKATQESQQ